MYKSSIKDYESNETFTIGINENEVLLAEIRYCLQCGDEGELKPYLDAIRNILFKR